MADTGNPREDGSLVLDQRISSPDAGPSFITDGDRVEQPGTLLRDPRTYPQEIERERRQPTVPMSDRASDKFAVVTSLADQKQAYQLLPADYDRKGALIYCLGSAVYFGDETSVSNALGGLATAAIQPNSVFPWPASSLTAGAAFFALEYTSKQGLYVCSASATAAQVIAMVEKFGSGTPVR